MLTDQSSAINFDIESVRDWLNLLYGPCGGYVSIVSTNNWAGAAFATNDLNWATDYAEHLDRHGAKGVYARVTTLREKPVEGVRGSDEDSFFLPGLWADMDLVGPGHKTKNQLPASMAECQKIIFEAALPEPTLWVHSGGGLYPWWLFDQPWVLGPEGIAFAQEISRTWHDALAASAKEMGLHYGPLPDLARVLRIPGTVNRKVDGDPQPCRILEAEGPRYTEVDIASIADVAKTLIEARQPTVAARLPMPLPPRMEIRDRPGDALAASMSWAQILEPAGFTLSHTRGGEEYWVRPGKHRRDGHSVTVNYAGSDLMWVFSTEVEGFEPNTSYSKFAAWSILNGHGLDFGAAAAALSGGVRQERAEDVIKGIMGDEYMAPPPKEPPASTERVRPRRSYTLDDTGNAHRIKDHFGHRYRHVEDFNAWMTFDGKVWSRDKAKRVFSAAEVCTEVMMDQADEMEQLAGDDEAALKKVEVFRRHIKSSRSDKGIKAAVSRLSQQRGIAAAAEDFDQDRHLITVHNGVLNLQTGELSAHDPNHMLTRQFNAPYEPGAACPKWTKFLEDVLPDPALRDYVQRAMGYTLLGDADRRSMFLLYGPSGTGKSQFIEAMAHVFGQFAQTAAASTFRKKHGNSGPTNDLHGLKGKRLISSSETSETSELDEELIKRFTGRDQITSRDLYEKYQSWVPEGVIWLTTNYLPKLSSDDNAVWLRVKPIEFAQVFAGTDADQPNVGVSIAEDEAAGILNWLMEGVASYRAGGGLFEPEKVKQSSADHRRESDNVTQFFEESVADEQFVRDETANDLKVSLVFDRYEQWCKQNRVAPLGIRRFNQRLTSLGMVKERRAGYYYWLGWKHNPVYGIAGTMT
jgi:putative DNA primase/helicase